MCVCGAWLQQCGWGTGLPCPTGGWEHADTLWHGCGPEGQDGQATPITPPVLVVAA